MAGRLDIAHHEWQTVDRIASAVDARDLGDVVRLERGSGHPQVHSGLGHWTVMGPGITVTVSHRADAPDDFDIGVPLQLVRHAAIVADEDDGCVLIAGDDYQYLEAPGGSSAVTDAPEVPDVPSGNTTVRASARVRAGDLLKAVHSALGLVVRFDDQPPPAVTIAVEDGMLGICTDWRPFGASKSTYRVPAWSGDGSASSGALLGHLPDLLRAATRPESVVLVEICTDCIRFHGNPYLDGRIDELGGDRDDIDERDIGEFFRDVAAITGGGESWTARLPAGPSGAHRWSEAVASALDDAQHDWEWLRPGVIGDRGVGCDGAPVAIEFCDTEVELLRLTRQVRLGAHVTAEQGRAAAGRLTATQTELRFWLEEDVLVVGYDLPCTRFHEVPERVEQIVDRTEGLGALIGLT